MKIVPDKVFGITEIDSEARRPDGPAGQLRFPLSGFRSQPSRRASSLVTALLVLVVLSTIVLALMQSMSVERASARSVKNTLQATLLADAATDDAIQRLSSIIASGPYGAIFVRDTNGSPYLFLAKRAVVGTGLITRRIPLFSTAVPLANFTNLAEPPIDSSPRAISDIDSSGATAPRSITAAAGSIINLNSPNAVFANGLVGLAHGSSPLPLPVNWIYVNDAAGRVVGRYAYWVDDECCKLDLRYAGQAENAAGNHTRGYGTNASDLSLLALTNSPAGIAVEKIAGLLALRALTNVSPCSPQVQYSLSGSSGALSAAEWNRIRPFVTVFSLDDDRALDGKRRQNLNEVVSDTANAHQVEKEISAIRGAITNSLPNFGMRYFSSSAPSPDDRMAYVTKLAANIRDFIDADAVATIIQPDGTAYTGNAPDFIPYEATDGDLPIAFGKESGPFLSEYFRVVRVIAPEPHPTGASPVPITVRFAHYIELSNPTGKTINYADLGPSPFVMLANRRGWNNVSGGAPSVLRPADIKIRLPATLTIPAGGFVVLTTDGPPFGAIGASSGSQHDYIGPPSNRCVVTRGSGPGHWELVNTGGKASPIGGGYEDYLVEVGAISSDRFGLQDGAPAGATYADQRERLLFGNDDGLIDYSLRIFTDTENYVGRNARNPTWNSTFLSDASTTSKNTPNDSSNEARFTRGDVRSNAEVSAIRSSTSACWKDGGAGYGTSLPASQESLGGTNFNTSQALSGVALWRQGWYEYTADAAGNHFVLNGPIGSVGELGSVYDPVRYSNDGYRSQGATLRIGQSDSATNNRAFSSAANYTNWLGGRGSDEATRADAMNNASLLLDVFRVDDTASGRINPNCLVRDPSGFVFRAALDRFKFESAVTNRASSALSGIALDVSRAVSSLQSFATNASNGYLVSIGDLSRAPDFSSTNTSLAGVSLAGVSDAGREEFMRRSANLLSTQSLAFTVFVRAEAGGFIRGASGEYRFQAKASSVRETVVQLLPTYDPSTDPAIPVSPTGWTIAKPRAITY